MKAEDAFVAWTPTYVTRAPSEGPGSRGDVRVLRQGSAAAQEHPFPWTMDMPVNSLGAWGEFIPKTRIEIMASVLSRFHTCVVRDGIDPRKMHKEMLKVDEYRRVISPDCEGASNEQHN